MNRKAIQLGLFIVALAVSAGAQTVISSGTTGTVNNVPYISAATSTSTTLGVSPISVSGSNVGIGTTSPTDELSIVGSGNVTPDITSGSATSAIIYNTGHAGWDSWQVGVGAGGITGFNFADTTAGVSRLTINNSGNVGIGMTPNAWGAPYIGNVLQVGSAGFEGSPAYTILSQNAYFDGSNWRFINSGTAQLTFFVNGDWYWQAASGVGGGAATFSTPMALVGGNLGIGTTSPGKPLDVSGTVRTSASGSDTGGVVYPDGTQQTTAWTGVLCGGDYAEAMNAAGGKATYEPGDVLILTPGHTSSVQMSDVEKSAEPYSAMVAGIYATKPGVVGRRQALTDSTEDIPMAMVGVVPTKVSAENGPIQRGDLLVTSSTAGYAMKGTDRGRMLGAVIGKAMGELDSGTGVIEVLVTLQ